MTISIFFLRPLKYRLKLQHNSHTDWDEEFSLTPVTWFFASV